jgi:hypothetical protein
MLAVAVGIRARGGKLAAGRQVRAAVRAASCKWRHLARLMSRSHGGATRAPKNVRPPRYVRTNFESGLDKAANSCSNRGEPAGWSEGKRFSRPGLPEEAGP